MPSLSVVVTTFNRRAHLRETLAPLLAGSDAHEVLVVDDGSADGTRDLLDELAATSARLRPLSVPNGGELRARATGAAAASGDVVLFLDDDVVAAPGLLRAHRRRHADRRSRVVLGYMPVRTPASTVATALYADEYEGRCRAYEDDPDSILLHLWAGNFSMRSTDAAALGLADTSYRERYHPDRDLGLRCRARGLDAVFAREAAAEHRHERSLAAFARDARSQGAGRVELHRLHHELLGPLPRLPGTEGPLPLRAAVRALSSRELICRAAVYVLIGLARTLPARGARIIAARLLRRVAQARGAREALAR